MAYERHEWVCGEKITAELMNNLEGGVEEALSNSGGGGAFYIEATGTPPNFTGDKTFAELLQAIDDGRPCFIRWDASQGHGQQIMVYSLAQYTRSGSAPSASFSSSLSASGRSTIETLKMSENGAITII